MEQQFPQNQPNRFVNINDNVSILRGSIHQRNDRFGMDSRGKQYTGVAAVACVEFRVSDPITWTVSNVDYVMIEMHTIVNAF